MIGIKAEIELDEKGTAVIDKNRSTINNIINVSSLENVIGQDATKKINGFTVDQSGLGGGDVYVDKLPYVIGRYFSDSNGNFSLPYIIQIMGTDIQDLIIVFDKPNGAHPNSITVQYLVGTAYKTKTVYDDDTKFEIVLDTPSKEIIITIDNWNMPNSPFIVMGIYAIGNFTITADKFISFDSDIMDRTNAEQPNYGLISNSANLTFIDFDKEVLDLISKRILTTNKRVTVWLENTIEDKDEQLCLMGIRALTYNNDNLQVSVSIKDNLETLQGTSVEPIYYDFSNPRVETAKWYYDYLYNITIGLGYTFVDLDEDTLNILENTTIEYPLLESDTLWNEWNKLCELCLLHMYIDNNGQLVLK